MKVVVIDTQAANTASVRVALERAGAEVVLTREAGAVRAADRVVLPGVGAFADVRTRLNDSVTDAIIARIQAGRATLGICLGMQLLARGSDESPGAAGLGVLATRATRFPAQASTPQLGWNGVRAASNSRWLTSGAAYFANSFRLTEAPAGWLASRASHGGPFIAALERGNVLLCQFHPELSGDWGLALLDRWVHGKPLEHQAFPCPGGLTKRIIPCLDVRDGRVVKGVQFQDLRDAGDPAALAAAYADQGADELCLLDVSATSQGRSTAADTVRRVRAKVALPLTVGGGVRTVDDARRLLCAGADKVAVNTAAVDDPSLLQRLSNALGSQCVVLAVDAAATPTGWQVVTHAGTHRTGMDAVQWVRTAERMGAGEVLLTSWDRDGTRAGYDLDLVRAVSSTVRIPVIASGGAATAQDLADALSAGAQAALAASVFHDQHTTVAAIKQRLTALQIPIRPVFGLRGAR